MKTPRIEAQLSYFVTQRAHRAYRQPETDPYALAQSLSAQGLGDEARSAARLRHVLAQEKPVVFPDERIALLRTVRTIPEIHTREEDAAIRKGHALLEMGRVFNMCPCFELLLDAGFAAKRTQVEEKLASLPETDTEGRAFLTAALDTMEAVADFAARYREEALKVGNAVVADTLSRIPAQPAATLLEALQFLRLLHYSEWCNGNYHNTLGRIDQYLYPYYAADLAAGRLTRDEALELLEEFFIACNRDSDLYVGIQQGDNGQTIVLGGTNLDGSSAYNELSELCLLASRDVCLIDPKVNLRVSKDTPDAVYELATTLTAKGLGFPQYSNDDVIIPCLLHWGYEPQDAYNYTLAACWEILIPGYLEMVNWDSMSFLGAAEKATQLLPQCPTFADFKAQVRRFVTEQAEELVANIRNVYREPSPFVSLMFCGCVETARDVSKPGKYNNFGFHGDGVATAADTMAAIEKYVYNEKAFTAEALVDMLASNFEGHETEQNMLRYEAPKYGNNDDRVDGYAVELLDWYADAFEGKRNEWGGMYRAGTASAMFYIWHSKDAPASADGRGAGEPLACNYSPSVFARCNGPMSIIRSFSKPHLGRVANGGPLTIELHDTVFANPEGIEKCAQFVKTFMALGGHQMQINAVNRDRMLDAQKHPENYRNLIVRVWGWSGYFVELDEVYQNHIISRSEMVV